MNKEQLLDSPYRGSENLDIQFQEIFLIPLEELHESGFNLISIIGKTKEDKYFHCGSCDDISTIFPILDITDNLKLPLVRMDCVPDSMSLRYHGRSGYFIISEPLSSIEITFISTKNYEKSTTKEI
jgi:hypothetical protein